MIRLSATILAASLLFTPSLQAEDAAVDLESLNWETNLDDPPIGDPAKAVKGGTFRDYISAYPKTFRVLGPNSNEMWANWRNNFMQAVGLVGRHPQTDNFIPGLATHWSIQPDNKTVYFRLRPEATWSDGKPITADDYTFAYRTMLDPGILDPFVNQYIADIIESVEKIDTHTIKVVAKQESWRVLDDLALSPLPAHAMKIEPGWEVATNYTVPVTQGPYTIGNSRDGEFVELVRNPNWWGYQIHYYAGMYNPDRIVVRVILDEDRILDFFQRGELDYYSARIARVWATQLDLPIFRDGYASKKQLYVQTPDGMSGLGMNLQFPLFQNKDFRKALQYMFDFDKLNSQLMFNSYFRKVSAFTGTEYENKALTPYGFDPRKARTHLQAAGFNQRGRDGILVNARGERASFTLLFNSKSFEPHLTIVQQDLKRAGIEMRLQILDPATYFQKVREKATEAFTVSMTAGFYPEPFQYFHSSMAMEPQTNNFWSFSSPRVDELIDIYRFDLDRERRLAAMAELDQIIQDEAFYIPFWTAPFMRFCYWNWIEFPADFYPKRASNYMEYPTWWINEGARQSIEAARAAGRKLPADTVVEVDPHGVKPR